MTPLAAFEEVTGASGVPASIEAMLPAGVRPRQLSACTLLAGMCLAQADHRPAHLTRVHQALVSLPEDDQRRPGVLADWNNGPHLLTYRQAGCTFAPLQAACDDMLKARIPCHLRQASRSLAVDWSDLETFSPAPRRAGPAAAPTPGPPGGTARTTCAAPAERPPAPTHGTRTGSNGSGSMPATQAAQHIKSPREHAKHETGQQPTEPAGHRNVRPKCETRPHSNVKTSQCARQDSNPRPAA
jgi:hypothetical protein